ncbi:MAG: hypothetical protein HKM95_09805 [Inquilinus sp.]|nr:hypothetical protein [Inquilinus sp.]
MITDILLLADAVLKLVMGAVLAVYSNRLVGALGLPSGGSSFYPRLLGGLLLGVGVARLMAAMPTGWAGLGIHGAAMVNVLMGAMLVLLLIGRAGRPAAAGQRLLWGLAAVQLGLGGLEWLIFGG